MADPLEQLVLIVNAGVGEDDEAHAQLARRLRRELAEMDAISRVEAVRTGDPPPGAKGDVLSLSSLAVAVAPAALTALLNMLQTWLSRHERATVTIEGGGQKVTISGSPSKAQEELLAQFLEGGKAGRT